MINKEIPAYVCSHIFDNTRPILLVYRENDEWQFLCGGNHSNDEIPRVVGMNHLLERDSTLLAIMNIENGYEAERKDINSEWRISKL